MEGEHRVQIVLPPVTGEEKGSCPPAYVDALHKLCDWYTVIESRLSPVCSGAYDTKLIPCRRIILFLQCDSFTCFFC